LPRPVTIIIADDCDAYRTGFVHTISSGRFNMIAAAANGLQLIELVKQHQPDIVFIDIRMPVMDGIAACRELQATFPHIGKIALTMYDHHHPAVQEMLKAGVLGFLNKDAGIAEITRCIETVYNGGTHYGSSCKPVLESLLKDQAPAHNLPPHLAELLRLIGEELSSEEIASIMHRSIDTIGLWRRELLVRCKAKNVAGLVKYGVKWGIIKL
jgi:DNA-binding NarL/FixJ family response regulator